MAISTQKLLLEIQIKNQQALGRVERDVNRLANSSKGLGINLRTAALALGAFATGKVVTSIIKTTARFEDLRTTLSSVTGSAEKGARAFDFIREFATRTQFGVEELTTTFIKLKTAGIEPTEELLNTFTDAAAVTTDQIGSLEAITDLYARTVSGGLGLEEIQRLGDRGIPILAILEDKLGLTRQEISEFGKTAEGARKIVDAFGEGIRERFGGATQKLLGNLSVAFSNLQIELKNAAAVFGQGLSPVIKETAEDITRFVNQNQENLKDLGAAFGVFAKFVIENIDNIAIALLALNAKFAMTPLGRIVSLILAAGVGAAKLYNYLLKVKPEWADFLKGLMGLNKEMNDLGWDEGDVTGDGFKAVTIEAQKATLSVQDLGKAIQKAFDKQVNKGLEDYRTNLKKLIEDYTLSATITGTLTNATNAFAKTAETALTDVVMGTKTLQEALGEIGQAILRELVAGFIRLFIVGPILEQLAKLFGIDMVNATMKQANAEKELNKQLQKQVGLRLLLMLLGFGNGGKIGFGGSGGGDITATEGSFANGGKIGFKGFRAGGGGVASGAYMVGERGPELFVPNSAGTIIPNHRMNSSGMGTTINFNINAVDASGFDELLLSRKGLIIGTIQQAMRGQGRKFA